jgi:hypothetical protein
MSSESITPEGCLAPSDLSPAQSGGTPEQISTIRMAMDKCSDGQMTSSDEKLQCRKCINAVKRKLVDLDPYLRWKRH